MDEITSNIQVLHFCEWCWSTLKEDGTCPTEGCIYNELMELEESTEEN